MTWGEKKRKLHSKKKKKIVNYSVSLFTSPSEKETWED
jgi:hypothetical protein